jgi:hypothetical protein
MISHQRSVLQASGFIELWHNMQSCFARNCHDVRIKLLNCESSPKGVKLVLDSWSSVYSSKWFVGGNFTTLLWLAKVKVTLRLTVSQYVLVSSPIWGSWPDIYYCLTVTVLFLWVALSVVRTCLFSYILLALDSAIFLGSESLGTRDNILLSQIWDFHFRRLLGLAGLAP